MAQKRKQATDAQTKKYLEWIGNGSLGQRPAEFDNTAFDGTNLWHITDEEAKAERVDVSTIPQVVDVTPGTGGGEDADTTAKTTARK